MASVIVRNLDKDLVKRLKARAAERGVSLEQSLRDLLEEAANPDRTAVAERIEGLRARLEPLLAEGPPAEELIREDRLRARD